MDNKEKYKALCFNSETGMTTSIQEKCTLETAWKNETPFNYKGFKVVITKNTGYKDTYIMTQYMPRNLKEIREKTKRTIARREKGIKESFQELFYTKLKGKNV